MRRANDQAYGSWADDELLRRLRLSIGPRKELHRPLRKVWRWRIDDPSWDVREALRGLLEVPRLRQLLSAPPTRAHRPDGRAVQRVRASGHQGHHAGSAALGPLPEHEVPRKGGQRPKERERRSQEGDAQAQ